MKTSELISITTTCDVDMTFPRGVEGECRKGGNYDTCQTLQGHVAYDGNDTQLRAWGYICFCCVMGIGRVGVYVAEAEHLSCSMT